MALAKSNDAALSAFAFAKDTPNGRRPQAIAHRGYKAKYPENTMSAFRAAVEVGADALELDLHLTKDGVVVLSHDPTLKRCFGVDARIVDCTWEDIQSLRTIQIPHEPMPRLTEFLEWLASPGHEHIWVILDIKLLLPTFCQALFNNRAVLDRLDRYADDLFHAIAVTLAGVQPAPGRPWRERVTVGCWAAKYLPLCFKHLGGYPITHIGFSVDYARHFLTVPGVNVSLFLWTIVGPRSDYLLRETRQRRPDRAILFWTVNPVSYMKWCIRRQVDGVITDDPKRFLEVCKSYKPEEKISHSWATWKVVWQQHWRMLMKGFAFRYKHGYWIDMKTVRAYLENGSM